jgi:uncharacterized protein (DUF58 family)
MLGLTLLVLLIGSINYQLNLGYLLTFLLAGSAAAGTWISHRNLLGLQLEVKAGPAVFAGQMAPLHLTVHNPASRHRYTIGLACHPIAANPWLYTDIQPRDTASCTLYQPTQVRGWQAATPLGLQTHYPLGIFRVWTFWQPAIRWLVYPAPERSPPPLPFQQALSGASLATGHGQDTDFDGVRPYRPGDPINRIVWKKMAQSSTLVSRHSPALESQPLWLEPGYTGTTHRETSLSRLTAWVLEAELKSIPYGLRLPTIQIPPGLGEEHRHRCLEALALC